MYATLLIMHSSIRKWTSFLIARADDLIWYQCKTQNNKIKHFLIVLMTLFIKALSDCITKYQVVYPLSNSTKRKKLSTNIDQTGRNTYK